MQIALFSYCTIFFVTLKYSRECNHLATKRDRDDQYFTVAPIINV